MSFLIFRKDFNSFNIEIFKRNVVIKIQWSKQEYKISIMYIWKKKEKIQINNSGEEEKN